MLATWPSGAQLDAPFGQVEIQGAALFPRDDERFVRRPKIGQRFAHHRVHLGVGLAVEGRLGARISQPCRRTHHAAQECMAALVAVRVEHHAHRQARPVHAFLQGAEIGGEFLRQHRHDAVGEIGAVAALQGFLVQRRARRHIMGDIGDGDEDDMAALVGRIVIRPRPHRIVMVARIFRIDGDEGNGAQIGAPMRIDGFGRLGFVQHALRKDGGNAMGVNGDQADGARAVHAADAFHHPHLGKARGLAADAARTAPIRYFSRRRHRSCPAHIRRAPCDPPA